MLGAGGRIQPEAKAKPVKKMSCQPKGLKNQGRSDHHSAGRLKPRAMLRLHSARQKPIASQGWTRLSAMTSGIIISTPKYIGRISK